MVQVEVVRSATGGSKLRSNLRSGSQEGEERLRFACFGRVAPQLLALHADAGNRT